MTGKSLSPENDILYQWRLRRKLEETKKNSDIPEPILQPLSIINEHKFKKNEAISTSDNSLQINDENEKDKDKKSLMSIQTQTSNMVDTEIQTEPQIKIFEEKKTLRSLNRQSLEKIELKRDKSVEYEIPTKDCGENNKEKYNDKNIIKKKFTSSSPIKPAKNSSQSNFCKKNSTIEPIKISLAEEKNEVKESILIPDKSKNCISKSNSERRSVASSFTSTLSSICSSITNVTGRESPINLASSSTNQMAEDTKTIAKCENSLKKIDQSQMNETRELNLTNEYTASFDENDKELFESDDILRILLKKSYFYQLKLK